MTTADGQIIDMREPCPDCGGKRGYIIVSRGQNTVRCMDCQRWCYNAPNVELGLKPRTVATVHASIKPKTRLHVLERATGRCELCGACDAILHVSHILSVDDGLRMGLTERELNGEENLAALCEACNLGLGAISFSPRIYMALLRRRVGVL